MSWSGFILSKFKSKVERLYFSLYLIVAEDLGGVSREWFSILSRALFAPSNKLFIGFREDNQALVYLIFNEAALFLLKIVYTH